MRHAAVYAWQGRLYICAMSRTVEWLWIASPPFLACDEAGATDQELGQLVADALDGSRMDVPHPSVPELEQVSDPLLELAGVTSVEVFERDARVVEVHEEGGVLTLTPTRNAGRDGFVELPERAVQPGDSGGAALGEAVRRALAQAE